MKGKIEEYNEAISFQCGKCKPLPLQSKANIYGNKSSKKKKKKRHFRNDLAKNSRYEEFDDVT